MNVEGKKLLILGGIQQNLDMIKEAHKLGVIVYVTDYIKDSPCKKIADKAFDVSATDVDAVVELIKKENIDGVITGYVDLLLPYYAEICKKANLPSYATKDQFDIITNKRKIKEACIKHNIPVPSVYTDQDIENDNVQYPVMVKPTDSSGSRGCTICYNKEQAKKAIAYACTFSKAGEYLVEEYMSEGRALLQFFIQDGDPVFMCCGDTYDEEYYADKPKIASCGIQPSKYTSYFLKELYPRYRELFKDLGLQNGPVEIEVYVKNGVLYWGDIGYRLCGGRVHYLTAHAFNINFYELLICFAITGKSSEKRISDSCDPYLYGKHAAQVNFSIKPGRVNKIIGIEKLNDIPEVFFSSIYIQEGFVLKEEDRGKLIQTVGRVRVMTDTTEKLIKTMHQVFDAVDFLNENGASLKLDTAYYEKYLRNHETR